VLSSRGRYSQAQLTKQLDASDGDVDAAILRSSTTGGASELL
jgi:hypothetical protein